MRASGSGNPARMGEIQIWDVAKKKLLLSHSITGDTLYGVSWSPDGKRLAINNRTGVYLRRYAQDIESDHRDEV